MEKLTITYLEWHLPANIGKSSALIYVENADTNTHNADPLFFMVHRKHSIKTVGDIPSNQLIINNILIGLALFGSDNTNKTRLLRCRTSFYSLG